MVTFPKHVMQICHNFAPKITYCTYCTHCSMPLLGGGAEKAGGREDAVCGGERLYSCPLSTEHYVTPRYP